MKKRISRFLDFVLDEKADTIAPWVFFGGAFGIAMFFASFLGMMIFLYLAAFISAGVMTLCSFHWLVGKYRDRKYQEETKEVDDFRSSLDFVQKHGADDLSDEQISVLVKRTKN